MWNVSLVGINPVNYCQFSSAQMSAVFFPFFFIASRLNTAAHFAALKPDISPWSCWWDQTSVKTLNIGLQLTSGNKLSLKSVAPPATLTQIPFIFLARFLSLASTHNTPRYRSRSLITLTVTHWVKRKYKEKDKTQIIQVHLFSQVCLTSLSS